MKLTNISLAVLVALGLVACGGSDDNKNQTTDPKPPKTEVPGGGDGGNGGNGGIPDKSGLDPERVAPDLTVPKDLQTDVNVSKATYLSRGFADQALGYPIKSRDYDADKGTDPADIKFSSTYKFLDEGDVVDANSGLANNTDAIGAIYVGQNPDKGFDNNAFAKIGNKYYRVVADLSATGNKYTPKTPFVLVRHVKLDVDKFKVIDATDATDNAIINELYTKKDYAVAGANNAGKTKFEQSEVVFIANAKPTPWMSSGAVAQDVTDANDALVITLGNEGDFATRTGQTVLNTISVLGKDYVASATGQSLDFSKLPVNKDEIQLVDVSGKYTISNDKLDGNGNNDFAVVRDIDLGKIKAYNLPYSLAYVTIDPSKKNDKNIFNINDNNSAGDLNHDSYQVRGYQTISLPKDGRAHYYGKSFNATVEGDIKLTADFFSDRAGVQGTVTNRKDIVKDKALPNLRLDRLTLTDPDNHGTFANTTLTEGVVHGDPKVNSWSVQFYGLEAQEAGGKLYHSGSGYEEVYTTQREGLTNLSNDNTVK